MRNDTGDDGIMALALMMDDGRARGPAKLSVVFKAGVGPGGA